MQLRKKQVIIIILFFTSSPLLSQLFYTHTYAATWENSILQRVEPDFSYSSVKTLNGQLSDIAISPTGLMYGVNYSVLMQVNIGNGELTPIDTLPFGDYSYSLVYSHDHHLYTLAHSGVLYAYDLLHDTLKLIDYLGNQGQYADDIALYRGNVIFQGYNDNNFYAYNLEERTVTWIICNSNVGESMNAIGARMNICGEEELYGITRSGRVYQFNIDNNSLTLLHSYGSLNFKGYGMATTSEHLGSTCNEQLLGEHCDPLSNNDQLSQRDFLFYPNPVINQLFISTEQTIEMVDIHNADGRLVKSFNHPVFPIDVECLQSGIYFLKITCGELFEYKTVIIQ